MHPELEVFYSSQVFTQEATAMLKISLKLQVAWNKLSSRSFWLIVSPKGEECSFELWGFKSGRHLEGNAPDIVAVGWLKFYEKRSIYTIFARLIPCTELLLKSILHFYMRIRFSKQ